MKDKTGNSVNVYIDNDNFVFIYLFKLPLVQASSLLGTLLLEDLEPHR